MLSRRLRVALFMLVLVGAAVPTPAMASTGSGDGPRCGPGTAWGQLRAADSPGTATVVEGYLDSKLRACQLRQGGARDISACSPGRSSYQ